MKPIFKITAILILVVSLSPSFAQEQIKTTTQTTGIKSDENATQKAQNNNTVRSNRGDNKAIIDQSNSGGPQDDNNNAASSKKGYDYYKAKSDMNSTGAKNKAQDHNSSRSNKTASKIDQNNSSGETQENLNKK